MQKCRHVCEALCFLHLCGLETGTWNEAQQSRIRAVEMSYLRGACGITWQDLESNESIYERFGMESKGEGIKCGVVE